MYRPQNAYPAPPETCDDQRFHYAYDQSNLPRLASGTLAAGAHTGRIPLQMDQDAAFFLRAIQQQTCGLQLRLETPHGEPLSDSGNSNETINYVFPVLYSETDGAGLVVMESEVFCPRGGVLNLYLNNPTSAPINMNTVILTLHGIKRYSAESCQ